MEPSRNPTHDLFSRGSTPPSAQPLVQQVQPYPNQRTTSNTLNPIDSLFHNINGGSEHQQQADDPVDRPFSGPESTTPNANAGMMGPEESGSPVSSPATSTNTERQNALLSLLGTPSSRVVPPPQQVPTPPGSSQRSGASPTHNETQGKILLEQLMAGSAHRSSLSDSASATAPSPPYAPSSAPSFVEGEYRTQTFAAYDVPEEPQRQEPTQQPAQSEENSSPRKSMFDFVSAFDALSTAPAVVKKKPVPSQLTGASNTDDSSSSWTSIPAPDPKRQSVDNLLEHLARGQPLSQQAPAPQSSYDPYLMNTDYSSPDPAPRAALPIPPSVPTKANRTSPRMSPPKVHATAQRPVPRTSDSPSRTQPPLQQAQQSNRREKESSPGPRGSNFRSKATTSGKGKMHSSPSPHPQSIIFDVSQTLDDIQASRDAVKSTPIALVRQDSVFLPGTTIGATHWVAYAMTRGRVRIISRSSGDRTLMQLPAAFPPTSSVTDMAVHGNRLAGVTSDGGFVVWELPEVITDDAPGILILYVPPSGHLSPLHSVKWHPQDPDTLAVASDNMLYLIDLANTHALGGQALPQSDLHHVGQTFSVPSPLVAFDFDVPHYSIATISQDSTLMLWNIRDRSAYATHKIRGEDTPSSLTFVDGSLAVGRKNGTVFQLLSASTKSVVSTIKFINGTQEDPDMFGHVNYDTRIQTLWIANSRRNSLIAVKINFDSISGEDLQGAYFDQVVEFVGPKPTIHFVILTADADPHGNEAHAACVAAKEPVGDLALVAFSVHSSGVDQVLIRKEWFNSALSSAVAKFPPYALPQTAQIMNTDPKGHRPLQAAPNSILASIPARSRTPQSEEVDIEQEPREDVKPEKGRGNKSNKSVGWVKDRDDKDKDRNTRFVDPAIVDSSVSVAITREIKKSEDNLHTRLSRLIGKEMDKQHQRLEEARVHDQGEDFARQEKILKLISTELTKNTTRVVEMAVKHEVQNSVLPSLENIMKNEVKVAMKDHVGRGLSDYIGQSLPGEIERLFRRPDISKHFSQLIATTFTPVIETNVKEALNQGYIPFATQQSSAMHTELLREFRAEIYRMKNDLSAWQNEAFRSQEKIIRNLEHNVQLLSDQVKYLSLNASTAASAPALHHLQSQPSIPSPGNGSNLNQQHRSQNVPPSNVSSNYPPNIPSYQNQAPSASGHGPWFGSSTSIAAPQASHPATLPQAPPSHPSEKERTPPMKAEQWDDIYLSVLHTEDPLKLRDLLARTNPEVTMPLHGPSLVSQAVVLTLIHRLSTMIGETSPTDESFKSYLWWLQRSVNVLNPMDKLISDFIPRVVPNIQKSLNATRQRLSILPGGPLTADTARSVAELSENLRRKASVVS